MDRYQEDMMSKAAQQAAQNQCGESMSGNLRTAALNEPMQDSLIDRVRQESRRAAKQAAKSERLKELQYLLEKNPEVARILDLMEEVNR